MPLALQMSRNCLVISLKNVFTKNIKFHQPTFYQQKETLPTQWNSKHKSRKGERMQEQFKTNNISLAACKVYYRQTILPNPVTEIVFFFLVAWMICIENDITVSTVKLSDVLFRQSSLSVAINTPYLLQFVMVRTCPLNVFSVYLFQTTQHIKKEYWSMQPRAFHRLQAKEELPHLLERCFLQLPLRQHLVVSTKLKYKKILSLVV